MAVFPRAIVWAVGVAEMERLAETLSVTPAVCVIGPDVPVIVKGYEPDATEGLVVTLRVVAPELETDSGVKEPVAPEGRPLTLKCTAPPKPASPVMVAV